LEEDSLYGDEKFEARVAVFDKNANGGMDRDIVGSGGFVGDYVCVLRALLDERCSTSISEMIRCGSVTSGQIATIVFGL